MRGSPASCYHAAHAVTTIPEARMSPTDLCYTPATKLLPLIRSKKLSPVELTKAVLARIEKLNPKLNAFCLVAADHAMKAARMAEQAVMKRKKLGKWKWNGEMDFRAMRVALIRKRLTGDGAANLMF